MKGPASRLAKTARWLCVAALCLVGTAHAIIIRHDKNYADYRAVESDFPAVFYLERQGARKVCVATLITAGWAITAAHCAEETGLQAALQDGLTSPVLVAGRQRLINRLAVHPLYQPGSSSEVDLALVRFAEPLAFPTPVVLNSAPQEAGQVVSLLGWGFFGIGTTGRSYDDGQFRRAENRIEQAGQRLRIRFDDPREPGSTALEREGMPGLGDSGGPALVRHGDGWMLVGVAVGEVMTADFSEETQGSYGAIAVYERVSRHLDWIQRIVSPVGAPSGETSD